MKTKFTLAIAMTFTISLCLVEAVFARNSGHANRHKAATSHAHSGHKFTKHHGKSGPLKHSKYYKDDGPSHISLDSLVNRSEPSPVFGPIQEHKSKPYAVLGLMYYPQTTLLDPYTEKGVASWYGKRFHGKKTAAGEKYDMHEYTAAHPTLPIPSYAKVTNLQNGKTVIVKINDRGPFLHGRIIDLSYAAAAKIGLASAGSGEVQVEKILPLTRLDDPTPDKKSAAAAMPFDTILADLGIYPPSASANEQLPTSENPDLGVIEKNVPETGRTKQEAQ